MDIVRLKPTQWLQWRSRLLAYAKRYGDRRLTAGGLQAMQLAGSDAAPASALLAKQSSTPYAAVLAHRSGKLLGFAFAADGGRSACLVVVHPEARGQGVGLALIRELIGLCDGLSCRVAADNTASLRMFFRAGLKAVAVAEGPTGKPTLKLQTDGFDEFVRLPADVMTAPSVKAT